MAFWHRWIGRPDRDVFARMLVDSVRRSGPSLPIAYDPESFKLELGEGAGRQLYFLANAYREFCDASASRRGAVLARWTRMIQRTDETPSSWDELRPNLLPRLRDRAHYALVPLRLRLQGMDPPEYAARPVAEHLALGLVHDLPESVAELPASQFADWGVPLDEAYAVARQNLERLSREPFERIARGVFASPWHDSHDASRLVLADVVRRLGVRGTPVAMVPSRDALLVTGADDVEGLGVLASVTEKLLEQPRPLSGIPVWLDDDGWRPFLPDDEHPHAQAFARLRVGSILRDYAEQKSLLDTLHERDGIDLFVASYTAVQHRHTGRVASFCAWTRGVDALLPRTDDVVLTDPDETDEARRFLRVPWTELTAVAGAKMEALDLYPPRWRVTRFPDAAELEALRRHARVE